MDGSLNLTWFTSLEVEMMDIFLNIKMRHIKVSSVINLLRNSDWYIDEEVSVFAYVPPLLKPFLQQKFDSSSQ
jgi:hypothetical protein